MAQPTVAQPTQVVINAQLVSFGQTYRNAGVSRYTYMLLEGLSALAEADRPNAADAHSAAPGADTPTVADQGSQPAPEMRFTAFVNPAEAAAAAASPLGQAGRVRLTPSGWPTARPAQRIVWEQIALPGELRRLDATVFHSPVNVLPLRLPCASVVTVHDLAFVRYPQYFRAARRIYQRRFTAQSVRAATLVVAVSESTKRDLMEEMGATADRTRVIYPCIAEDFRPIHDPARLAAFREAHQLPRSYLLFLGTLEPRKNLETLVEAYAQARAADSDIPQLVIAGAKGWYYQSLFERVRTLGLEREVTFAGYVNREEQPLWYAAADLFLYPSVYEGFGLPIAEALACGTPTITSNVSSMPEAAGSVATQVDPHDVGELAYAMRQALIDPTLRQRVAVEGPQWAGRFTPERMARQYREVYREAAAMGRRVK